MIIGVTGKSGSGKSTYANKIAESYNAVVVHVDEIGHKVLERKDIIEQVIEAFGVECIDSNGKVKRKCVGDLIFNNRHAYEKLTSIVWSVMKQELDHILRTNDNVILDWLLLPHTHYWQLCDKKLLVVAESDVIRKQKVMERDNISKEYLEARDSAGINYDNFIVDETIVNNYNNKYKGDYTTC